MALKSGSLGTLLQGVSQQPDRVRLDGQLSEQINMRSDVTDGLSSRPATTAGDLLIGATPDMKFDDIKFDGESYIIGYKPGTMEMWTNAGVPQGLAFSNDALVYVGDEMEFHVVDKQIVAVNRSKVVRKNVLTGSTRIEGTSVSDQTGREVVVTIDDTDQITLNIGGIEIGVTDTLGDPIEEGFFDLGSTTLAAIKTDTGFKLLTDSNVFGEWRYYTVDVLGQQVGAIELIDYTTTPNVWDVEEELLFDFNADGWVGKPPPRVGLVQALGGQFSNTYEIDINWQSITGGGVLFAQYSYTAPDGDAVGDAAETSADFIIQQLANAIASSGSTPAGAVVEVEAEVLRVVADGWNMEITTRDGEGGTILRSVTDEVRDIEDLPRFAPNGHVVKVINSDVEEDDYWLKFNTDSITEDGAWGFGDEGTWKEWYNPQEIREFDLTTMPHVIENTDTGLTMAQAPWIARPVGDSTTAPFASIVDKPIRDIDGFEGRIAMISPNSVVMTRTDFPFDLWRESATVKVATDPIDFTSTKKDELKLDWIVPFDRDLIILADPGDSQFIIRGGELDADNVGMVLTTEYEVESAGARPVSTGRTIFLPFLTGRFSGIKEFYTNSDNQANAADSLTETQDKYIVGQLSHMSVSQNFNLGLFKTDEQQETVWVYEYLFDGNEALQSAWHKWVFEDQIVHFFFDNSIVYFVCYDSLGDVYTQSLNLNRPLNEFGFHTMLDRNEPRVVSGQRVNLPYRGAAFMQGFDAKFPGVEVAPEFVLVQPDQTVDYIFNVDDIEDGMTLVCGQRVEWSFDPTQVFAKDYQNRIDTSQRVTIQDYVATVFETGVFKVRGTSPYAPDWEYSSFDLTLDNDPLDPDGLGLTTGPVVFPWGERADYSKLTVTGNDIRPFTMHELEWVGQVLKSRGRRT